MQAAYLQDADPAAVSHAVRDVVERRGGLVTEHVTSRVRFHSMPGGSSWSWTRAGYVGIYQHFGEKHVELRLDLKARWPHRTLWIVASVNAAVWLATLIANPSGTAWFVLAFLTGLALLVSGLLYANTWRSVRAQEASLMRDFEAELAKNQVATALLSADEHEARALDETLAGEVEQLRAERARKAAPKPPKPARADAPRPAALGKLKLSFGKKAAAPPEEDEDAKRARLLARKAELEQRKADDETPR